MNKATQRPANPTAKKIKTIVDCFAIGQGCTLREVYPSREEAHAQWDKHIDPTVEQNIFGSGGYITPITLEPSLLYEGMWCPLGAEFHEGGIQQAFNYFQSKDWMKPIIKVLVS